MNISQAEVDLYEFNPAQLKKSNQLVWEHVRFSPKGLAIEFRGDVGKVYQIENVFENDTVNLTPFLTINTATEDVSEASGDALKGLKVVFPTQGARNKSALFLDEATGELYLPYRV